MKKEVPLLRIKLKDIGNIQSLYQDTILLEKIILFFSLENEDNKEQQGQCYYLGML
jgi:hypothetical protein